MPVAHVSLPSTLAHLRAIASLVVEHRIMPFGLPELDNRLGGGGLRGGALHEATAQSCSLADDAATTLFLAGVAGREALRVGGPVLWQKARSASASVFEPSATAPALPHGSPSPIPSARRMPWPASARPIPSARR